MSGRIIVGVDGSPASKDALAWALAEAKLRGARVIALHAWTRPFPKGATPGGFIAPVDEGMVDAVRKGAEELLAAVVSEAAPDGADLEQRVVEGSAARALLAEAQGAELLVVGSRGHGGFAGLLLGSVSQQCAHHAPCPIVIIRAPDE